MKYKTAMLRPIKVIRENKKKIIPFLIIIVTITIIYWLTRVVQLDQFLESFKQANTFFLFLGVIITGGSYFARALTWKILLDSHDTSYKVIFTSLMIGHMLNIIFPARLGDLGRTELLVRSSRYLRPVVLASIIAERFMDVLVALIIVWVYTLIYSELPVWLYTGIKTLMIVMVLLVLVLVAFKRMLPLKSSRTWIAQTFLQISFKQMIYSTPLLLVSWLFAIIGLYLILFAFSFPSKATIFDASIIFSVTALGNAIPSLPSGAGTFHGLFVLTTNMIKLDSNTSLACAILYHFLNLIIVLIFGGISLLIRGIKFNEMKVIK